MKKIICLAIAMSLFGGRSLAQDNNTTTVVTKNGVVTYRSGSHQRGSYCLTGFITDAANSMELRNDATVSILRTDSVSVSDDATRKHFVLYIPGSGQYVMKVECVGYQTLRKSLDIKFRKREHTIDLGVIVMKRSIKSRNLVLPELTVKGTKLKFHFDKDTLIYDAQAFVTQEGFVLNDILKKMPGLEVNQNGEIYANGKKVEALLLNGKDFFNHDRKTILDNLPAFTLKSVKVYDKEKNPNALIRRERDLEGIVMDIRLKKEYEHFTIGNVGAGYGTDSRYHGQLFALKYNPLLRLSGYALSNNINLDESYTGDGSLNGNEGKGGDRISDKAGMNYDIDHSQGKYVLNGNVETLYLDDMYKILLNRSLYLNTGDVRQRTITTANSYIYNISTHHDWRFYGMRDNLLRISPSFSYKRSNILSDNLNESFGINREQNNRKNAGETMKVGLELMYDLNIPHTEDILSIGITGSETDTKSDDNNRRQIWYANPLDYLVKLTNQYNRMKNLERDITLSASYKYVFSSDSRLVVHYNYQVLHRRVDNSLYDVDPSNMMLLNTSNSYHYTHHENNNGITLNYELEHRGDAGTIKLKALLPLVMENKSLKYHSSNDTCISRRMTVLNPKFDLNFSHFKGEKSLSFGLGYELSHVMPLLFNLINRTDDTNPLYVIMGNPNLDNPSVHTFSSNVSYSKRFFMSIFNINHSIVDKDVVNILRFDRATGVSMVMPLNVDGNRNTSLMMMNKMSMLHDKSLSISNMVTCDWNKMHSFTSSAPDALLSADEINNLCLTGNIGFTKSFCNTKYQMASGCFIKYDRITTRVHIIDDVNTCDYGFRFSIKSELPFNMLFSSNLSSTYRQGYQYSGIGRHEFLWNASIQKTFGKHLSVQLDAKDILNQKSNINIIASAQSRTETQTNHLRRYILLHIVWRIDTPVRDKRFTPSFGGFRK